MRRSTNRIGSVFDFDYTLNHLIANNIFSRKMTTIHALFERNWCKELFNEFHSPLSPIQLLLYQKRTREFQPNMLDAGSEQPSWFPCPFICVRHTHSLIFSEEISRIERKSCVRPLENGQVLSKK